MRDGIMERLVVLPFSVGCISEAGVVVLGGAQQQPKRWKSSPQTIKNSFPKPNISSGFHRLFKKLFEYKEEIEKVEMEIGSPTDVKHVTHIGWDDTTTTTTTTTTTNTDPIKAWDHLLSMSINASAPGDHLLSMSINASAPTTT